MSIPIPDDTLDELNKLLTADNARIRRAGPHRAQLEALLILAAGGAARMGMSPIEFLLAAGRAAVAAEVLYAAASEAGKCSDCEHCDTCDIRSERERSDADGTSSGSCGRN